MGRGPRGSGGPGRLGGNWVQTAECGNVLVPRALRWRPCIGRAVLERPGAASRRGRARLGVLFLSVFVHGNMSRSCAWQREKQRRWQRGGLHPEVVRGVLSPQP